MNMVITITAIALLSAWTIYFVCWRPYVRTVQPYRDEYLRCLNQLESSYSIPAQVRRAATQSFFYSPDTRKLVDFHASHPVEENSLERSLYRAAKALQIAETLGPDQALLWKLSN